MHTVDPHQAPHSHDMIQAYVHHLHDLGRADSTVETYVDILARLDRTLPHGLTFACTDELRAAIYTSRRGPAARALCRAAVGGFFGWATREDDPRLDYDPARRLPASRVPQRIPRPCTHAELAGILAQARDPYRLWYLLAAGCGLRCVEISRLSRADVTEATVWLLGKGGRERVVPTHPAVWQAVRDLPAGPVARRRDGTRATRHDVRERANRHLGAIGHGTVTMHRLRHWYGTYMYEASGRDLRATQLLMGHTTPSTTQIYVAVSGAVAAGAVRALPLPA